MHATKIFWFRKEHTLFWCIPSRALHLWSLFQGPRGSVGIRIQLQATAFPACNRLSIPSLLTDDILWILCVGSEAWNHWMPRVLPVALEKTSNVPQIKLHLPSVLWIPLSCMVLSPAVNLAKLGVSSQWATMLAIFWYYSSVWYAVKIFFGDNITDKHFVQGNEECSPSCDLCLVSYNPLQVNTKRQDFDGRWATHGQQRLLPSSLNSYFPPLCDEFISCHGLGFRLVRI